ncbi:MAG: hypothetical protein K2N94_05630 [Lachnospiraceae bacterium]|nr:hypothetical protein [Lachnospiraceae bacterium]
MDFIIEFVLTIILEGTMEAVGEKRLPMYVRVIAALLLLVLYFGLGGLLMYEGIKNRSGLIIGIAVFVLVIFAWAVVSKYREIKKF